MEIKKPKSKRGFTLIELMVIISIVSLFSTTAVVATKQVRDKSKTAKSTQEAGSAKQALQVYESTNAGFPNPEPLEGERKLYCIGSTKCALHGKAVTTYLNPETGSLTSGSGLFFGDDLIPFTDNSGLTQGYMYLSCGGSSSTCDPDDTAFIYANSSGEYYSFMSDPQTLNPITDNFNFFTQLGFNLDTYPAYGSGGGGSQGESCEQPVYSSEDFSVEISTGGYFNNELCSYISTPEEFYAGYYECDVSCNDAINAFESQILTNFPNVNCPNPHGGNPRIDFGLNSYFQYDCDWVD